MAGDINNDSSFVSLQQHIYLFAFVQSDVITTVLHEHIK